MSAPLWVHELSAAFWKAAGGERTTFPRDIRAAMTVALPLSPVSVAGLQVSEIDRWLARQGITCRLDTEDRPLRACLIAYDRHGAVFFDGIDPAPEQRFSLAHELAHFLHDYWEPRRQAVAKFGPEVLEVFDGVRPARPQERIHALLALVPIGFQIHLLERAADGRIVDPTIEAAEQQADRLAFQLLAPEGRVLAEVGELPVEQRRSVAEHILTEEYGLPIGPAATYAAILLPQSDGPLPFIRRLWPVGEPR